MAADHMSKRNAGMQIPGWPAPAPATEEDFSWMQLPAPRVGVAAEKQLVKRPDDSGVRAEDPPLLQAAVRGDVRRICEQLNLGADLEAKSKQGGWTALHLAARNSRDGAVNLLLTWGADVRAVAGGGSGDTPLHQAAEHANSATLLALLEVGADPDAPNAVGDTPLHAAVRARNTVTTRDLACHGANAAARNRAGDTPLHLAAADSKAYGSLLALLQAGADPSAVTDSCGRSPLHLAAIKASAEILLKAGARVDACDELLRTPLHAAATENRADVVRALLRAGADCEAQDVDGRRPHGMTEDADLRKLLLCPSQWRGLLPLPEGYEALAAPGYQA